MANRIICSQTCVILQGKGRITLMVAQRLVGLHLDLGLLDFRTVILKQNSVVVKSPSVW